MKIDVPLSGDGHTMMIAAMIVYGPTALLYGFWRLMNSAGSRAEQTKSG